MRRVTTSSSTTPFDVIIIGAGVVGCALARRFSLSGLTVAVLDRASDVGEGGASKSNSAIVHTGFDCEPHSLEGQLVSSSSQQWQALANHLKIPYQRVGALMLAQSPEELQLCKKYHRNATVNRVETELLTPQQCRKMEPLAYENRELVGGLHIPGEAIVDPFATVTACAEVALSTGKSSFFFHTPVVSIEQSNQLLAVNKRFIGRTVINCAGLGGQSLYTLGPLSEQEETMEFELNPRRGQFLVYDSLARSLVNKILLPLPTAAGGKGILITPTVFGNVLCGPTSEDLPMSDVESATQTTREGLNQIRNSVFKVLPKLKTFSPIAQYAGARSNCKQGNYVFDFNPETHVVTLTGIRSTGLSASFAIADYVFDHMLARKMIAPPPGVVAPSCPGRTHYPSWTRKNTASTTTSPRIVCYCESVTETDISAALDSPLCPPTTDAVKRRTRATAGRCQGFNCLLSVCKQIANTRRIKVSQVRKNLPGTEWFPHFQAAPAAAHAVKWVSPLFSREIPDHYQVIVVGSGPAGCGVLEGLSTSWKVSSLLLLERTPQLGGTPARFRDPDKPTFLTGQGLQTGFAFSQSYLTPLLTRNAKVNIKVNASVIRIETEGKKKIVTTSDGFTFTCDHLVLATGARERTAVERNVVGHRAPRMVFSSHLLEAGSASLGTHVMSLGAGLVSRSLFHNHLKKKEMDVHFVVQPFDEYPRVAELCFPSSENAEIQPVTQVVWTAKNQELFVNRHQVDGVVLGGNLTPNKELQFGLPESTAFLAGNCVVGKPIWPGFACYLHAKHVVSRRILSSL